MNDPKQLLKIKFIMRIRLCYFRVFVFIVFITGLSCSSSTSQLKLLVIKANSNLVDIKESGVLRKNAWHISPRLKLDVYRTSVKNAIVTFYTDIDSISFRVEPNKTYDFVILLNGKDSAFTQIKYAASYLEVLKSADKYDYNDKKINIDYTYRSKNSADLKSIRKTFKLDSIAGSGDEISKLLNILHWVHLRFPHDGSKDSPQANGTEDLMTQCIRGNKTLNCGALAGVLNDCFLSMGFISRQIVCLPKDSTDADCHSINAVYSRTLKKWLWMDATFYAYALNENNKLLSISEVRDRLIHDKPLKINSDANWNYINKIDIKEYLYNYMAKNLYALQFYYESYDKGGSILLLSIDYKGIIPRTKRFNPVVTYNPDIFWKIPSKAE